MKYVGRGALFGAFIFLNLLTACQKSGSSNLTPSGRFAAETTAYPGVVMIILPGGTSMCTGSIVSPTTVLTAAHCALNQGKYTVVTDFGEFTTYDAYHAGVGGVDSEDDIAILVFPQPIIEGSSDKIYAIGSSVSVGETLTIVGYGCDDIDTKQGAGIRRMGTNEVDSLNGYVFFKTPFPYGSSSSGNHSGVRGILGPDNEAGSCFGDSGGPAFDGGTHVVAVTHAGGQEQGFLVSEYTDLTQAANHNWLVSMNQNYNLGIHGL